MASPAHRPRKRFGQHFLVQPQLAQRIVALAELRGSETVLEIGPGRGALTDLLTTAARELWLIEIDRDLHAALCARFATARHVHVIEGDALRIDYGTLLGASAPAVVVANLPYNIATPLLMQLLEHPDLFTRLVVMVQREIADRLAAGPGSKSYGALSVMFQLLATLRTAVVVGPGAFHPRPKVDSAVVVIDPRPRPGVSREQLPTVRRVVRAAFAQRRKQLGNALSAVSGDPHAALHAIGIDPKRRAETLSIEDFVALSRVIQPHA
jgi:16S rRNA (adenine1518-N6/adenine1519-N6)-dimethyltransferase